MPTVTRRVLALWTTLTFVGCVPPPYRAPTANEPHAILKIRRSYEQVAGTTLDEAVDLNEHRALEDSSPARVAQAPRIDAILVRPEPLNAQFSTGFSHTEMRTVQEQYTEQTPYTDTDTDDCSSGFGTTRVYRSCTRMVTRYRSETKYRWVTKPVAVSDGSCARWVRFAPVMNHVYLLEYTYQDNGACSLSCFEQSPDPGAPEGSFHNAPCPAAPAAE